MKALLLKDFYSLRKVLYQCVITFLILLLFSVITNNPYFIGGGVIATGIMIPSTITYQDEYYDWNAFLLTTPIRRTTIVKEKYIFTYLCQGGCVLITVLSFLIINMINKTLLTRDFSYIYILMVMLSLATSVSMPVNYKLKSQRGRMIPVILFSTLSVLILFIRANFISRGWTNEELEILFEGFMIHIVPFIVILSLIASYIISCCIVNKKDF